MTAKKRIFLLDDETSMTQLMGTLLSHKGFEVKASNDSEKALEALMKEPFDTVIIDLMMPRIDGFSVIARLRTSNLHLRTPIVALSAKHLDDAERKRLLTSGVRYVSKPVSPTRLFEIVRDSVGA